MTAELDSDYIHSLFEPDVQRNSSQRFLRVVCLGSDYLLVNEIVCNTLSLFNSSKKIKTTNDTKIN